MLNCLKFHLIIHDRTESTHQQETLYSQQMISWARGLLRAVNSLQLYPDKCDVIIMSSAAMNI